MKFTELVRVKWQTVFGWIKNNIKKSIAIGVGVIIVIIILATSSGADPVETLTVTRQDVVEQVRVAGRVEADIVADMGFENGGIVRSVAVQVNDVVRKGQRLVSLDLGTLPAELARAQAAVAIKRAQIQNTQTNTNAIREKQDAVVATAYQNLLSQNLVAEPESDAYTQQPPIITGRYAGAEGVYKIIIDRGTQNNPTLRTFDLERTPERTINKTGPTMLGTQGLYISFPETITSYVDTVWYVAIPNTKSAQYVTNYNAYEEALRERDRVIDDAEATLRQQSAGVSIAQAELLQAQAEVARIQALIGQRILTAPFDGVVTGVQVNIGESVTPGSGVVSMNSEGLLGVEVDLPEIDSVKVMTGDPVTITLDAFGDSEVFTGVVTSVNRSETIVDGVSVYEARIVFDVQDERIVSGMTTDVIIETNRKDDVIAIPARAITYRPDGTPIVQVQIHEKKIEEREVVTGIRGSDSVIHIVAGLTEGEVISIPVRN